MTTIVGIKTNTGLDSIVLASDTQMSFCDEDDSPLRKRRFYKIFSGDFWALAHAGGVTEDLRKFCRRLSNPDRFKDFNKRELNKMIYRALEIGRFIEIDELNSQYAKKSRDEEVEFHEFLFAVRPKTHSGGINISLYHIDMYGNLRAPEEGLNYLALGTEAKNVRIYLKEKLDEGESYDSSNIDLESAVSLCDNTIEKFSESDIYSGGLMDFVILDKDGINSYGKQLRNDLDEFRKKRLKEMIKEKIPLENN